MKITVFFSLLFLCAQNLAMNYNDPFGNSAEYALHHEEKIMRQLFKQKPKSPESIQEAERKKLHDKTTD